MTNPELPSWPLFMQQLQNCLLHLYDYAYLQGHPLLRLLIPGKSGPERVQAFRDLITESIEQLRPGTSVDLRSKAARGYNLLVLRYVAQQQTQEVIHNLAFSERQFYREHPKAIRSLCALLWERVTDEPIPDLASYEVAEITIESEVQHAHVHSETVPVDPESLIAGVVNDAQALAHGHAVRLDFKADPGSAPLKLDRMVLRQAVLGILSFLITRAPGPGHLHIRYITSERRPRIAFRAEVDPVMPVWVYTELHQQSPLQTLISALGGTLNGPAEPAQGVPWEVTLELPRRCRLLVIDDNPDAVDLFKRYLVGLPYDISSAQQGTSGVQTARDHPPDLIVLDIMLSGQDGLELLQVLKNHPATSAIPVLVCSVLELHDLVLSLHADGYLRKPPGQLEFIEALERALA